MIGFSASEGTCRKGSFLKIGEVILFCCHRSGFLVVRHDGSVLQHSVVKQDEIRHVS